MKIKMLTLAAGPEGVTPAGCILNVNDIVAKQLIAGGYAIAVEADNENDKTAPDGGAAKPRRSKAAPKA